MAAVPAYSSILAHAGPHWVQISERSVEHSPTSTPMAQPVYKKKEADPLPFRPLLDSCLVRLLQSLYGYCTVWRRLAGGGGLFSHPDLVLVPRANYATETAQTVGTRHLHHQQMPGEEMDHWGVKRIPPLFGTFFQPKVMNARHRL